MKIIILFTFIFTFFFSVDAQKLSKKNTNALLGMLTQQQACWNRGSIDGYMAFYWNSDSLRFITKNGITFGWKQTMENYKKHYPDLESMGKLAFDELHLITLNAKQAMVLGRWTLTRIKDTLGGQFSLVCKKISGKWLIIMDHTS